MAGAMDIGSSFTDLGDKINKNVLSGFQTFSQIGQMYHQGEMDQRAMKMKEDEWELLKKAMQFEQAQKERDAEWKRRYTLAWMK